MVDLIKGFVMPSDLSPTAASWDVSGTAALDGMNQVVNSAFMTCVSRPSSVGRSPGVQESRGPGVCAEQMSRLAIILTPAVATNLAMCTRNFSRSCPCVAHWLQARSPGVHGAGMEDTPWSDDDLDRTAKAVQKRRRRSVQTPNVQESESPWSHDLTAGEDDPWLMDGDDPWLGMDSVAGHPSSTSTGSAQAAARTTNTVSLTPSSLALVAHTTPGGQLSAYATKGMDPCKVKERLTTAGRQCRCRDGRPCNNNVPLHMLQRTCSIFGSSRTKRGLISSGACTWRLLDCLTLEAK